MSILSDKISPALKNYALALLIVAMSFLLTVFFQTALKFNTGLFFFSAVLLSTWFGDRRSGFFATILASLALNIFLNYPQITLDFSLPALFRTFFFAAVAFSMSLIMSQRKQSQSINTGLLTQIETERKRLSDLVASVPGVVWEAWGKPDAASQRINFVSNHVETMLGYTVKEWLATPNFWLTIVHPEDKERAAAHAAEHFRRGGPDINSFRWTTKDGRILSVDSHSTVILDENNNPLGMRGVTLDVSERKRAEEALRESENRFRTLIEQSHFSTQIFSPDGTTILTNSAWEKLWGLKLSDFPGGYNILQDDQLVEKGVMSYIRKAFDGEATAVPAIPYDLDRGSFAGQRRWVSAFIYPVIDAHGEIREIVLMHEDITERVRLEIEREKLLASEQQARIKAEEANQIKDEFLATLSHELRTPLSAILGWAQMLKNGNLDRETTVHAFSVIERNARNQNQLIEDILDVSRIITGKFRLNVAPLQIETVVETAIDAVRLAARVKNIQIHFTKDKNVVAINGDADRLQQVCWNLLSNAIKFTPENGEVNVEIFNLDNRIRIDISDNGIGIEPRFLPFVFDRFRQADGSTTRKHGGLGLGLSIVRHIVEIHGGSVRVKSEGIGRGATFSVELPILPDQNLNRSSPTANSENLAAHQSGNIESSPAQPRDLNGYRILIVEDEKDSLDLLRLFLTRHGAEVIEASSAKAAFECLKNVRPDLIVSDIGMPDENGYDLLKKIRALNPAEESHIPAIALTAYAGDRDRELAKNAGFQRHIPKPVEEAALIKTIISLLDRKEQLSFQE